MKFRARLTFVIGSLIWFSGNWSGQGEVVDSQTFESWMSELSNWGRWGAEDGLGTVNLITPQKRVRATRLVQEGIAVSLAREVDKRKSINNPNPFIHEMISTGLDPSTQFASDRYSVGYHGVAHTHLDALCHAFHHGKMYNGFTATLVTETGCERLSIRNFANGILTRGVLVDIASFKGVPYLEPGTAIFPADLDGWTEKTGIEIQSGDVVLIRTGKWVRLDEKGSWNTYESLAGLHASSVKWLRNRDVAIVGTDAAADVIPSGIEGERFPVHKLLMVAMGTPIFDNLDLEALSKEAKRHNRWEFLFIAAPLVVSGGTGSPLNPTAVF